MLFRLATFFKQMPAYRGFNPGVENPGSPSAQPDHPLGGSDNAQALGHLLAGGAEMVQRAAHFQKTLHFCSCAISHSPILGPSWEGRAGLGDIELPLMCWRGRRSPV